MYTIQKSIDESLGVLVLCYLCNLTGKTGKFEIMGEAGKSEFKAFPLEKVSSLNMPDFYKEAIKRASQQ